MRTSPASRAVPSTQLDTTLSSSRFGSHSNFLINEFTLDALVLSVLFFSHDLLLFDLDDFFLCLSALTLSSSAQLAKTLARQALT
jgi:hypothetical protein